MRLGFQNKKQKVILFVLGLEMLILLEHLQAMAEKNRQTV